jgi:hypothetical protein
MRRFLDPKNDLAFKRLFGTEKNKGILLAFLNDIFDGVHPKIEDMNFHRCNYCQQTLFLQSFATIALSSKKGYGQIGLIF